MHAPKQELATRGEQNVVKHVKEITEPIEGHLRDKLFFKRKSHTHFQTKTIEPVHSLQTLLDVTDSDVDSDDTTK